MTPDKMRFLGLYEPDVSWTDFLLSGTCWTFAYFILTDSAPTQLQIYQSGIFFSCGLAAFCGGIAHGFFRKESGRLYRLIWKASLLALVVNGSFIVLCALSLFFRPLSEPLGKLIFYFYILGGASWIHFKSAEFKDALIFYLPAVSLLLLSLLNEIVRQPTMDVVAGFLGVTLSLLAGYIQSRRIALHKVYFNHNAVYHLVQVIAFCFVYLWARSSTS